MLSKKMTLLWILLAALFMVYGPWPATEGIQVIRFQEDGLPKDGSRAVYKPMLDRNKRMLSLTLCMRLNVFYLLGRDNLVNLRDNVTHNPFMIKVDFWPEKFRPAFGARWNFMMLQTKLEALTWYHVCFAFDDAKKRYLTWINGRFEYELNYTLNREVYGDFAMIGRGGEIREGYSGDMSQVNIWDRALTDNEVAAMANCKSDLQGNYLSWNAGWDIYFATTYDVPLTHFCEKETGSVYFWFPDVPWTTSNYLCESLGTHLPMPKTVAESDLWLNMARDIFKPSDRCGSELIVAMNDVAVEGTWKRPYDGEIVSIKDAGWEDGEPNGLMYENCAQIEEGGIADVDCITRIQCAVCEFKRRQVFSLRGTCEMELRNINFLAYQENYGDIMFRGYGEYQIIHENGTWIWRNVASQYVIATMVHTEPNYPMGKRYWKLQYPVCEQESGQRMLLLTPCSADQYSCDDATCIARELRCDFKYDCIDRSDERECEMVVLPPDYKLSLPPRGNDDQGNPDGTRLPVTLNIVLETMTIDTTQMTLHLTYRLTLIWLDNRLQYLNMKANDSLNILPFETMSMLWSPVVGYVNTEGNQHTFVDIEASLLALRRSLPSHTDDAAPAEVDVYPGSTNPLKITRKYSTEFACDFDLVLYPFDEQYCDLYFRIISASQDYLYFDIETALAEYEGSTVLIEYTVGKPFIQPVNSRHFSEMKVRVPLTRQYGYAILNIYTPSLILIVISYLSLFFRPEIFEVRVMTALTSLLVVATLFTQVSSSLPKTSYFKMVDIWLLFCIGIIFAIIIFLTFIDHYLQFVETEKAPSIPPQMFVRVGPKMMVGEDEEAAKNARFAFRLIRASKVVSLLLFVVFNVFYWAFIMA